MNETITLCLEIIFWLALFIVFYTYLGYGIVLYVLVKLKELFVKPVKRSLPASDAGLPEVTLFITAFNEEDVVDEKMENSPVQDCSPSFRLQHLLHYSIQRRRCCRRKDGEQS